MRDCEPSRLHNGVQVVDVDDGRFDQVDIGAAKREHEVGSSSFVTSDDEQFIGKEYYQFTDVETQK